MSGACSILFNNSMLELKFFALVFKWMIFLERSTELKIKSSENTFYCAMLKLYYFGILAMVALTFVNITSAKLCKSAFSIQNLCNVLLL